MSSKPVDHEFFEIMRNEHAELGRLLTSIRNQLDSDQRDKLDVEKKISHLTEIIESHFSHEERDGYLREALQRAPRLATRADTLLKQHDNLMERVQSLSILVHSGIESDSWWKLVNQDFTDFASRLLDHEAAENRLIQEAFTDDIGTGD